MIARTWHGRVPTAKAMRTSPYYDDDDAFLLEKEPFVAHADVVALAIPASV
jgi:hypothetical protein